MFRLYSLVFSGCLCLFAFSSCLKPHDPSAISSEEIAMIDSEKAEEFIRTETPEESTAVQTIPDVPSYEIRVFRNMPSEMGYGYDILQNGKTYIHQTSVPAIQGTKGFSDMLKARKAAEFVVFKLNKNIFPPTVSKRELDSLGVLR